MVNEVREVTRQMEDRNITNIESHLLTFLVDFCTYKQFSVVHIVPTFSVKNGHCNEKMDNGTLTMLARSSDWCDAVLYWYSNIKCWSTTIRLSKNCTDKRILRVHIKHVLLFWSDIKNTEWNSHITCTTNNFPWSHPQNPVSCRLTDINSKQNVRLNIILSNTWRRLYDLITYQHQSITKERVLFLIESHQSKKKESSNKVKVFLQLDMFHLTNHHIPLHQLPVHPRGSIWSSLEES